MDDHQLGFMLLMVGYAKALEVCRVALVKADKPTERKYIEATYLVMTRDLHDGECVYKRGQGWICDPLCAWYR